MKPLAILILLGATVQGFALSAAANTPEDDVGVLRPASRACADFADSDAGGPDFWEIAGPHAASSLQLRARPSLHAPVAMRLKPGQVLRNLGCKTLAGKRWCHVGVPGEPEREGWVQGKGLRESSKTP